MKVRMTGLAVLAAIALVSVMASSAFAIEAFQERFEWGDLSKPTTLHDALRSPILMTKLLGLT